jgi:ribulose-bisphosphate carboxylase large chain
MARRNFPDQFLHYHRAGHGAVTSTRSARGYTVLVHMKLARLLGASGIHTGAMGYGKMEGDPSDRLVAHMLERDEAPGLFFRQNWHGMKPTTPIISGGMNALRLPGFFANLGHANVIQTSGGGVFGHQGGAAAGARSLRQAWAAWRDGVDLVEAACEQPELAGAFHSFPDDADRLYPGWRDKLIGRRGAA